MATVRVFNPNAGPVVRKDGGMIGGHDWAEVEQEQVQHLIERGKVIVQPLPIQQPEPEPIVEASKALGDEPDDDSPEPEVVSAPEQENDTPDVSVVNDESAPVVDTMSKTVRRSRAAKKE
jgi:hypothetical protein